MEAQPSYEQSICFGPLDRPLTHGELFQLLALFKEQKYQCVVPHALTLIEYRHVDFDRFYKVIFYKNGKVRLEDGKIKTTWPKKEPAPPCWWEKGKIEIARPANGGDVMNCGEWGVIRNYVQEKIYEAAKLEGNEPPKLTQNFMIANRMSLDYSALQGHVINPLNLESRVTRKKH